MAHSSRRFIPLCVLVSVLSWASAYPVVRLALRDLPPLPLAALRYALAALLAATWLLVTRAPVPRWRDGPRLLACGVFGITLYNIFFNLGETTLSSGATSLVIATGPIMAGLLAVLFTQERVTGWGWLGSLTSFAGVAVIVSGQKEGLTFGSGAGMALIAAFCAAMYTVLQRPLVQRYGGLTVTAYVLMIGAFFLLPWLREGVAHLSHAPARAWWCVAELGLVPAVIGYAVWSFVIGALGAARGAMMLYFLPPVTFILAFLLEGVWPDLVTLLGGAVVLLGVGMSRIKRAPKKTA